MKTFVIVVGHGVIAEGKREFFVTAETKRDAYWAAKSHLMYCGDVDGYEYILEVEEVEETEEATEEIATVEETPKSTKKAMKTYIACIREKGSKNGYVAHEFTTCSTKAEVRQMCKENGYQISGNKVYTLKEWNN